MSNSAPPSDSPTLHVSIDNQATKEEFQRLQERMDEIFGEEYQIVISTDDIALHELPALDDYADELAERVAQKVVEEL